MSGDERHVALVSGGNRGIGLAVVRGLAEAGLTVVLGSPRAVVTARGPGVRAKRESERPAAGRLCESESGAAGDRSAAVRRPGSSLGSDIAAGPTSTSNTPARSRGGYGDWMRYGGLERRSDVSPEAEVPQTA